MANPYLTAWRRRTVNRLRGEASLTLLLRFGLPLVGLGMLAVLVRPLLLSFLDGPASALGSGVSGAVLRLGLAMLWLLTLDVYSALIRGGDREVLALHPVDASQVVRYGALKVLLGRAWIVLGTMLLLLPIALEADVTLWVASCAALASLAVVGVTGSALIYLLAVDASESGFFQPMLDAVRGQNPREQAAFIYAPGIVLLGGGVLLWLASLGVESVWAGEPMGWAAIAAPAVIGVLVWFPVPRLADRTWFRASSVLADIDARYGALADRDEGLRVYLDWMVRWLPTDIARFALKDLRHGWRARRGWITGAWALGGAAGISSWTADPSGPLRGGAIAIAGMAVCATVAVLLERDEPAFLRRWLVPRGPTRWVARGLVVWAWLQGALPFVVAVVLIRGSVSAAASVFVVGELAAVGLVGLALLCSRSPGRGHLIYGPTAAVGAAVLAAVVLGGVL